MIFYKNYDIIIIEKVKGENINETTQSQPNNTTSTPEVNNNPFADDEDDDLPF